MLDYIVKDDQYQTSFISWPQFLTYFFLGQNNENQFFLTCLEKYSIALQTYQETKYLPLILLRNFLKMKLLLEKLQKLQEKGIIQSLMKL